MKICEFFSVTGSSIGRRTIGAKNSPHKTPLSCFPVIIYRVKMRKVESINSGLEEGQQLFAALG